MTDRTPIARGPIAPASPEVVVAGWAVTGRRADADLVITDCSPMAKVSLKASELGAVAQQLGVPFGRARREVWAVDDGEVSVLVVGSGPGEWLVLAPPGTQDVVAEHLSTAWATGPAELATVVDLTHGRALVRVTGARSARLLAKETAVDLGDTMCPDGTALRTAVATLATDLVRDDRAGVSSYLVHCERSSGQYLFDCLVDAGREFGIEVDGFRVD